MKESAILQHLEEIAEKLNIKVHYVNLKKDYYNSKSGLCKVKGDFRIIADKHIHLSEKIDVLIEALREFDIDTLYIHPYVRKLFEKKNIVSGATYQSQHMENHPSP
jgi:tRNA U34 2-thiouridine synthase MnmA/TrmU